MYQLRVEEVPPGACLAVAVEVGGKVLLREGCPLTERRLRRLLDLGIHTVYVTWGSSPNGTTHPQPSSLQGLLLASVTRRAAMRLLKRQLARLERGVGLEVRKILQAVHWILRDVLAQPEVVLQLAHIRALSDDLFAHQVQVAAISTLCGIHYGFTWEGLRWLAAGALLHDVGKVLLPSRAWMERRALSAEEYRQVQQHTRLGFELLRKVPGLDARVAHIAYQHHERWDGSGYPRGLRGAAIHPMARVVAVADVFDALTSDRPHRPAWPWHEAVEFIRSQAGQAFEPKAVRVFLGRVACYPVGTWVRLNTGQLARVVRQNPGFPARPVVRLASAQPGGQARGACLGICEREIDLSRELAVRILEPVPWHEVPDAGEVDSFRHF